MKIKAGDEVNFCFILRKIHLQKEFLCKICWPCWRLQRQVRSRIFRRRRPVVGYLERNFGIKDWRLSNDRRWKARWWRIKARWLRKKNFFTWSRKCRNFFKKCLKNMFQPLWKLTFFSFNYIGVKFQGMMKYFAISAHR
jgi:hypothetical protein